MNGIIGMTTLTLETELTRQQRENLMIVSSLANSLLTIIDDILDISKSKFFLSLLFFFLINAQNNYLTIMLFRIFFFFTSIN